MKHTSKSLRETEKIASKFLKKLKTSSGEAVVILLEGDLGSGKTTFTQFLAKELEVKNYVTSPTFVLMKKYKINHLNFKQLIHIDAYRLTSDQDLFNLGWDELASNPENLIVIEWPEKVADFFTGQETKINLQFIDEQTREIKYFL